MSTPTPGSGPVGANEHHAFQNVTNDNSRPIPPTDAITFADPGATGGNGEQPEKKLDQLKPQGMRKRGFRSDIWKVFQLVNNDTLAICNFCKKQYAYDSKNGTSTLWTHANHQCVKNPLKKVKTDQPILALFEKKKDGGSTLKTHTFNAEECRQALAEMVILDEYPFRCVEGQGFIRYSKTLEPRFNLPSRWTVARDCIKVYKDEKKKIKRMMRNQRICMTTDCWSSNQKINYMCLTSHWIDDNWVLQKKIINFHHVASHKGKLLGKEIEKCMLEWGVDNVLTLTADNASANDALLKYLKDKTGKWSSCIAKNEFLHVRCSVHDLNLIVKDGLSEENASIEAIRNAVKFIRSSPTRLDVFKKCAEIEKIKSKPLPSLDVDTRWNTIYLMLESAVDYEKVFDRLLEEDKAFKNYFDKKTRGPQTKEDWTCARVFVEFLKLFYDCTLKFSSSLYVTSNSFFREILQVHDMLKWMMNAIGDEVLKNMAQQMKVKYDKYWGEYADFNYLLFVCVVLDPRYKMKYVRWNIKRLCDNDMGKANTLSSKVEEVMAKSFKFYESKNQSQNPKVEVSRGETDATTGRSMYIILDEERDKEWEMDMMAEDWDDTKINAPRYPIVSKMARDLLAVPVSTVSSESAFSIGGRILDQFRSSLLPKTVERLLCAQSWLKTPSEPIELREKLLELEKYEEIASDLDEAAAAIVLDDE